MNLLEFIERYAPFPYQISHSTIQALADITIQLRKQFCSEKLNSWNLSFASQHSVNIFFALESKLKAKTQFYLIQWGYLKASSENQEHKFELQQYRYLN